MDSVAIRQMLNDDVDRCAEVFDAAINQLRRDLALPDDEGAPGGAAARIGYLLSSDRNDSVVAEVEGTVIGFAQATRRDNCWTLAHLFVDPDRQSKGAGSSLLATVHAAGVHLPVGFIGSTADPRAMRTYARLPGFRLHPTVRAEGLVTVRPVPRLAPVLGGVDGLDHAAEIDRAVRGSTRTSDLMQLLGEGYELRSIPDRGYAVANDTSVATISALDDDSAAALLQDALSRAAGANLVLPRMTATQQWAIATAVEAGLRLRPWGPLLVRGLDQPPSPYLPHPALS